MVYHHYGVRKNVLRGCIEYKRVVSVEDVETSSRFVTTRMHRQNHKHVNRKITTKQKKKIKQIYYIPPVVCRRVTHYYYYFACICTVSSRRMNGSGLFLIRVR